MHRHRHSIQSNSKHIEKTLRKIEIYFHWTLKNMDWMKMAWNRIRKWPEKRKYNFISTLNVDNVRQTPIEGYSVRARFRQLFFIGKRKRYIFCAFAAYHRVLKTCILRLRIETNNIREWKRNYRNVYCANARNGQTIRVVRKKKIGCGIWNVKFTLLSLISCRLQLTMEEKCRQKNR